MEISLAFSEPNRAPPWTDTRKSVTDATGGPPRGDVQTSWREPDPGGAERELRAEK